MIALIWASNKEALLSTIKGALAHWRSPLVIGPRGPEAVLWPRDYPVLSLELPCCGRVSFSSTEEVPLRSLECRHGNYWLKIDAVVGYG